MSISKFRKVDQEVASRQGDLWNGTRLLLLQVAQEEIERDELRNKFKQRGKELRKETNGDFRIEFGYRENFKKTLRSLVKMGWIDYSSPEFCISSVGKEILKARRDWFKDTFGVCMGNCAAKEECSCCGG